MSDDSNRGGGKTATAKESRALAALGVIGGGSGSVLLAKLRPRQRRPVGVRRIQQRADRGIRQPVRTQFGADAVRSVALPCPGAHDHLAEAVVVLIVLIAQAFQRVGRLLLTATGMLQPRTQFALRVLAAGQHAQRAVVGAAGFIARLHVRYSLLPPGEGRDARSCPGPKGRMRVRLVMGGEDYRSVQFRVPPEPSPQPLSRWRGSKSGLDFLGIFGRGHAALAGTVQQFGTQRFIELLRDGRVVLEILAGVFLALADTFATVAVPGAGLFDQVVEHAQLDQFTFPGRAFAVQDFELGLSERRRNLVLDNFDPGLRTDHFLALLYRADAADVEAHRGIELQRIAAGGGFRGAEHHADLHADLVDEDHQRVGALDVGGELAQRLAHQAGLQAGQLVAHFAFDFRLRGERGDRVDDDDVDAARAHQHVGDLERLLAGVGLRDQQVGDVHAELLGVADVED